nr:hypothetical protein [Tanacetum cinerariifolium]
MTCDLWVEEVISVKTGNGGIWPDAGSSDGSDSVSDAGGVITGVVSGIVVGIVPNKITHRAGVPMLSSDESDETEITEMAITCTSKVHINHLYINHAGCKHMNDGAWTEYVSGGVTLLSISSTKHNERSLRVKENQEKDKIGSKPDKNRKRVKARKSLKQLQWIKEEKPKKTQKEWSKTHTRVEYPGADKQPKLVLKIMDHDTFSSDDNIGQTTIYLKELLERGVENGTAELQPQKCRVVDSNEKYCGDIRVSITFTPRVENDAYAQEFGGWKENRW